MLDEAVAMLQEDRSVCRAIGEHGLSLLAQAFKRTEKSFRCSRIAMPAAWLRSRTERPSPRFTSEPNRACEFHVFADETRPLLQGSRITAYELRENGIPVTVLCDNMAATVMQQGKIKAVIVGTDRVAANGDVANKIGTLSVAILAKHFGIPFYVAAPISSIDLVLPSGRDIPIEQRDPAEVTRGLGRITAPEGRGCLQPRLRRHSE